jgi:hypothetical protein
MPKRKKANVTKDAENIRQGARETVRLESKGESTSLLSD